jgi:hypothetical protein
MKRGMIEAGNGVSLRSHWNWQIIVTGRPAGF